MLKRKGCRDTDLGQRDDTMERSGVGKGVNFFAAVETQDGSAEQEERDVGAYLGGYFEAVWTVECSV